MRNLAKIFAVVLVIAGFDPEMAAADESITQAAETMVKKADLKNRLKEYFKQGALSDYEKLTSNYDKSLQEAHISDKCVKDFPSWNKGEIPKAIDESCDETAVEKAIAKIYADYFTVNEISELDSVVTRY